MYEPAPDRSIEVAALGWSADQALIHVSRNVESVVDSTKRGFMAAPTLWTTAVFASGSVLPERRRSRSSARSWWRVQRLGRSPQLLDDRRTEIHANGFGAEACSCK